MTDDQSNHNIPDPAVPSAQPWFRNRTLWVAFVVFVCVVGVSVAFTLNANIFGDFVGQMQTWVDAAGPWGALVVIFLMVIHSFVFFPFELLAVVAGATYGFWYGSFIMWVGSIIAAAMCFQISRALGRPFLERYIGQKQLAVIDKWTRNRGAVALLVSRFLPIVSFNLINYGAGLTNISWYTFMWTTSVGIIPLIMLSVLFGVGLEHLPLPALLGLSALAVAIILGLHWLAEKRGWLHHADSDDDKGGKLPKNVKAPQAANSQ